MTYWPSRASLRGSRNRSNSISSIADKTSPAFRVFLLAFMAKLFALEQKTEKHFYWIRGKIRNVTNNINGIKPYWKVILRFFFSWTVFCESTQWFFLSEFVYPYQDVAYSTNTLAAWDMALRASFDTLTPSGSCGENKWCGWVRASQGCRIYSFLSEKQAH